jgi:hypothetical protein
VERLVTNYAIYGVVDCVLEWALACMLHQIRLLCIIDELKLIRLFQICRAKALLGSNVS